MAYQGSTYETVVFLTNVGVYGPEPVLAVEAAHVNLTYRPTGTYEFLPKTLIDNESWFEIGDGYYAVKWLPENMANQGELFFSLKSTGYASFDEVIGRFDVLAAPLEMISSPEICVVTGSIIDLGGDPSQNLDISFKLSKSPSVLGGSFIEGRTIRTMPNAYGNFSVGLLRGKKALVEIEKAGVKISIDIPDQPTANLIDLIPPILD